MCIRDSPGSLKNRLLQRAGINAGDLTQRSKDLTELQFGVYENDLSQNSKELQATSTHSDDVNLQGSLQVTKDLAEPQTTLRSGIYADKLPLNSQYLPKCQTTQAAASTLSYLPSTIVGPMSSPVVYPAIYRPGLAYHEAAATAALFYNQLAAVHHLRQHQQQIFLGAQNQLRGGTHLPSRGQSEPEGLVRLQQADGVK